MWEIFKTVLYWFNPFAYLLNANVNQSCEVACDMSVIKNMNAGDRQFYNRVLIGSEYAYIAGHSGGTTENTELLAAPILKDDTTYVPVDLFNKLKMFGQGVFENFVVSVKK